jgi:uncharacterized UPF0160 family protein
VPGEKKGAKKPAWFLSLHDSHSHILNGVQSNSNKSCNGQFANGSKRPKQSVSRVTSGTQVTNTTDISACSWQFWVALDIASMELSNSFHALHKPRFRVDKTKLGTNFDRDSHAFDRPCPWYETVYRT